MGRYGAAARIAVELLALGAEADPRDAWMRATAQVFPESESGRKKGCPRDAFLSLCEVGAVDGIPVGDYTRSVKNRNYMRLALEALRAKPDLRHDKSRLWEIATEGTGSAHNHQMDVLTTLWELGLLASAPISA
jgi:hypothetical protein